VRFTKSGFIRALRIVLCFGVVTVWNPVLSRGDSIAVVSPAANRLVAGKVKIVSQGKPAGSRRIIFAVDGTPFAHARAHRHAHRKWNSTGAALGLHTVQVTAVDKAGHALSTAALNVFVGKGVVISSPADNSTIEQQLNVTCEVASQTQHVDLFVDGLKKASGPPYSFIQTGLSAGQHNVTATAYDDEGTALGTDAITVNVASTGATPTPTATPTASAGHYSMQPPGAVLPSETSCAAAVNASPLPENAPWNQNDGTGYNSNRPPPGGVPGYFYQYAPGGSELPRSDFATVDGAYTGTTDDILRVYACKWGIDEDYVRAQAKIETGWHQDCAIAHGGTGCHEGGDLNRPPGCTPNLPATAITPNGEFCGMQGFGGVTAPDQYDSWSIVQNKVYYQWATWPMMEQSTPFAVDFRFAEMRGCVNGDQASYYQSQNAVTVTDYLNAVSAAKLDPSGASRIAGWTNLQYLAYGCIATHYSGRWFDGTADAYLNGFLTTLQNASWPGGNR
jgi:hypothetical protein